MIRIPAGPISPQTSRQLTELLQKLERLTRMQGTGYITVDTNGAVPVIKNHTPVRILMCLTGHEPFGEYDSAYPEAPPGYNPDSGDYYEDYSECRYSWYEVDINPNTCGYTPVENGRRGWVDKFPAVSADGNEDLVEGTIVEAWLAPSGSHWRFVPGGSGGGGAGEIVTLVKCVSLLTVDDLAAP